MQTSIKCVGQANFSKEDGEDILAGVSAISGFKFGYVESESKQFRVVSFHEDTDPNTIIEPRKGVSRVVSAS